MILSGTTYLGSLFAGSVFFFIPVGAWAGWLVGLVIVELAVFRKVHPLDRLRWKRFWNGHLFGFLVATIAAAIAAAVAEAATIGASGTAPRSGDAGRLMAELMIHGLSSLAGFVVGFLWAAIKNRADSDEVIALLKEWKRRLGKAA